MATREVNCHAESKDPYVAQLSFGTRQELPCIVRTPLDAENDLRRVGVFRLRRPLRVAQWLLRSR